MRKWCKANFRTRKESNMLPGSFGLSNHGSVDGSRGRRNVDQCPSVVMTGCARLAARYCGVENG